MSEHKCHCQAPAEWFLRLVPTRQEVLTEGHFAETIMADHSTDTWAVCSAHLAEAASEMAERKATKGGVLVLHREED